MPNHVRMDAMSTLERSRISVEYDDQLDDILSRRSLPGEPRARAVKRLVKWADQAMPNELGILVFHTGVPVDISDVKAVLYEDDM